VGLLTVVVSLAREPIRLTLRAWERGLSSAAAAARIGLDLLDPQHSAPVPEPYRPPPAAPVRGNGAPPGPVDVATPAPADSPPAVPDELVPDHVDEGVVLVAEVAEEGAEDGAGAEVHVEPPWDGYDEMTAPEIRDRLVVGDPVLAAAVDLYETTHKSRRTVIDAAERALKRAEEHQPWPA
jgi:hypothetical protein